MKFLGILCDCQLYGLSVGHERCSGFLGSFFFSCVRRSAELVFDSKCGWFIYSGKFSNPCNHFSINNYTTKSSNFLSAIATSFDRRKLWGTWLRYQLFQPVTPHPGMSRIADSGSAEKGKFVLKKRNMTFFFLRLKVYNHLLSVEVDPFRTFRFSASSEAWVAHGLLDLWVLLKSCFSQSLRASACPLPRGESSGLCDPFSIVR